jgi:hypothetical protein
MSKQEGPAKKLLVFLSHASEDKPKVRNLCKRLKTDGFDPWLDEERLLPGQDWDLEIKKAMRASDAMLLCFSTLSVQKEGYIQREYKKAMSYQLEMPEGAIYVIPVRLDACEIPFTIQELQYVDYPTNYELLVKSLTLRAEKLARTVQPAKPKSVAMPHRTKPRQTSSGPVYHIEGGIHAGRDVIQGDQTKNITITNITNITNIQSPAEFAEALQQVQAQVADLKQGQLTSAQARNLNEVESRLAEALEEAQKTQPLGERIKVTLTEAKETLELLGGGLGAALAIGKTIEGLILVITRLFGG